MTRLLSILGVGWLSLTCVVIGMGAPALQQPVPTPASPVSSPPPLASAQRVLLNQYCVGCHNQRLKTAGLTLDTLDVENVGEHPEVWEKAVRKLRAGLMPPAGRPRPDKAAYDGFTSWLETELDRAAIAHPNPGRTETYHRLNQTEYQTVIRDLFGIELSLEDADVSSLLPPDDASYGFDNIAGVLKVSPTLMERYLSAAQKLSRLAVGIPPLFPDSDTYQPAIFLPQDDRMEGLPFGTRGGSLIRHNFPVDAEYTIKVRLGRQGDGGVFAPIPRFRDPYDLEVSVDGEKVGLFTLAPQVGRVRQDPNLDQTAEPAAALDANWIVRVPIKAGPRNITATFLKKSSAAEETVRLPFLSHGIRDDHAVQYQPYVAGVTIGGPYNSTGPGDTPSRRRIFVCRPKNSSDEARCARTILSTVARRAYRRPVTDADLDVLLPFYGKGQAEGGFDMGIEAALERLLMSPSFLFRIERDPPNIAPDTAYRISDLELASRLSFFLWSSIPDDELLQVALRGELKNKVVLERQVRRMLADERSQGLVRNFAGQWLYLRKLASVAPNPDLFPDFDDGLRRDMQRETELLFDSIVHEDRSVLELLTANYTFVNERLAKHYGIPNVIGNHFRRVAITDDSRRGLLGQGSILTVTSYPQRTSPVVRGKWILENLLGTPPPEPPPNVPALDEAPHSGKVLTMRERMAQHRTNPVCSSCHSMMEPLGLALENYDAIGRSRKVDEAFNPIDASGALPDGVTKFDGAAGLRQALLSHSNSFVAHVSEKLLTYALGRGLEAYDMPAVRKVTRDSASEDYRFSSVILGIVNSVPFQMRTSQSQAPAGLGATSSP